MKKLTSALVLIGALSTAGIAHGAEFKGGGYVACISKDLLDQVIRAANQKDDRAMNYLLDNGCIQPREGIPVTILDSSWTGTMKVRAYVGDQGIELWTVREAINR